MIGLNYFSFYDLIRCFIGKSNQNPWIFINFAKYKM